MNPRMLCAAAVIVLINACGPLPKSSSALMYSNDFEDAPVDGQPYPEATGGTGTARADVAVQASFFPAQKPVATTLANGNRALRINDLQEAGSGYNHSRFRVEIPFRGAFLTAPILRFTWTVVLPNQFDYSQPNDQYDHRPLFYHFDSASNPVMTFGFLNNTTMGFVLNGVPTGQGLAFTQFAGGSTHTIVLTLENQAGGRIMATLDGSAPATVTYATPYAAPTFFDLTGPGNFFASDNDLNMFGALDSVEVMQLAAWPTM